MHCACASTQALAAGLFPVRFVTGRAGDVALAFGSLWHSSSSAHPPSPPRLYRMAPDVGGPIAKHIEDAALTPAELDARTCYVLRGPAGHFIWHGRKAHADYGAAARQWAGSAYSAVVGV